MRGDTTGINWNVRFPYNVVDAGVTHQSILHFEVPGESDNVPYPIPDDPLIEGEWAPGESDYHMLIVDRDSHELYEMGYVDKVGSVWNAYSGAVWDYSSNDLRPAGWTSTDAAGLPVLPGLVRYDEIAAGSINHALRFTIINSDNSYVWPARHKSGVSNNGLRPGMGQYFRLKSSVDIDGYSPQAKVIAQALKTYGFIIADNGAHNMLSFVPDSRWDWGDVEELYDLNMNDFEAVDVSSLMVDPDSGQARITPASTPTPTPTATPPGCWYLFSSLSNVYEIWKTYISTFLGNTKIAF
jgi:hypothetical protein